jgi:16S rRNA (cytidine1402-2'-O)-methyltransferase
MLYLIPTPIGNLEDITLRAIRILKEVDLILAEDTRTSRKLLDHHGIETPLRAHHAHNEHAAINGVLRDLQIGRKLALVSDAGTPGISDPGFLLVRECLKAGIEVQCLPGATAIVPALVQSGLPCDRFHFEGFLPHKKGRQTRLKYLASLPNTFALYESPHRLVKCLEQLQEFCGPDRAICVQRELSKLHEEAHRGSIAEVLAFFQSRADKVRGEIVIVVAGLGKEDYKDADE